MFIFFFFFFFGRGLKKGFLIDLKTKRLQNQTRGIDILPHEFLSSTQSLNIQCNFLDKLSREKGGLKVFIPPLPKKITNCLKHTAPFNFLRVHIHLLGKFQSTPSTIFVAPKNNMFCSFMQAIYIYIYM